MLSLQLLTPGRGVQASSWTPADLSPGALAWYDPSDLASLFQDTAGTVPVTASGQPVARMNDKSGNGYHLLQATAGNQLSLQQAGGLSWLAGDGTSDYMTATIPTYGGSAATVAAAVLGTTANFLGMIVAGSTGIRFTMHAPSGASAYFDCANSSTGRLSVAQTFTTAKVVANRGGTARVGRINGVSVVTGGAAPTPASPYNTIILGNATGGFAPARTYGFVVLQREVTDAELRLIEQWLAGKAGIVV